MKFLISNDDGFEAPGLAALYAALRPHGSVTVVAPNVCHSSKGHAVDTKQPIRVERRVVPPFGEISVVHSSPADCIRVGLRHVMCEAPDFVIAGINPGANLGVDLYYSGTAAAAREAALLGIPAIALSRYLHPDFPVDWRILSEHCSRVLARLCSAEFALPRGHFWNVNFPAVRNEKYPEEILIVPHGTEPHAVAFTVLESSPEAELVTYSGVYRERGRSDQCDVRHLFEQRLTATPIGPQSTAFTGFQPFSRVSLVDADIPD